MTEKLLNSVTIKRAEQGDEGALSHIGAKTFSDKFAHLYDPRDLAMFLEEGHSVDAYVRHLADEAIGIWKAVDDAGQIVGYAVAGPCGLPVDGMPAGAMEISRLYVDESAQSGGVGRRLMDAMLEWIDQDGPAPLYLSVFKYNDGAQRFYSRYGFGFLKEYKYRVGNHFDPEYIFVRNPDLV
ncbi:MAG: GNAT family N-acetyltransferase [Ponticaulis sp.]|nr:GNAT family N-acetyltransferase [Ponticaulis sp.]